MPRRLLIATPLAALAFASAGAARPEPAPHSRPLAGVTIALDPGHNGGNASHPREISRQVDAGGFKKDCDTTGTATNDGRLSEHAYTWDVARRVRSLLRAQGATVVLTRHHDHGVGPCIDERARIGNRARAAAAISIHADGASASGRGFHVIWPKKVGGNGAIVRPSRRLAVDVRRELVRAGLRTSNYAGRDGLIQRGDLGGLNLSRIPKVFVETGNMRNSADARLLSSASGRQRIARALAASLVRFAGHR